MKPPICHLCHADFRSEYFHYRTGGALVQSPTTNRFEKALPGIRGVWSGSAGIIFRPLRNWHPLSPTKR